MNTLYEIWNFYETNHKFNGGYLIDLNVILTMFSGLFPLSKLSSPSLLLYWPQNTSCVCLCVCVSLSTPHYLSIYQLLIARGQGFTNLKLNSKNMNIYLSLKIFVEKNKGSYRSNGGSLSSKEVMTDRATSQPTDRPTIRLTNQKDGHEGS